MTGGDRVSTPHGDAIVDACGTISVPIGYGRSERIGFVDVTYLAGGRRRYVGEAIAELAVLSEEEPEALPA